MIPSIITLKSLMLFKASPYHHYITIVSVLSHWSLEDATSRALFVNIVLLAQQLNAFIVALLVFQSVSPVEHRGKASICRKIKFNSSCFDLGPDLKQQHEKTSVILANSCSSSCCLCVLTLMLSLLLETLIHSDTP